MKMFEDIKAKNQSTTTIIGHGIHIVTVKSHLQIQPPSPSSLTRG
jgi:hypothetical protein